MLAAYPAFKERYKITLSFPDREVYFSIWNPLNVM